MIPRLGKERAIKLSMLTGTLLALAVCWLLVPGIDLKSPGAHLGLGMFLAGFMAGFDIAIVEGSCRHGTRAIPLAAGLQRMRQG